MSLLLIAIGGPLDGRQIVSSRTDEGAAIRVPVNGGFTTYEVVKLWENTVPFWIARHIDLAPGVALVRLIERYTKPT